MGMDAEVIVLALHAHEVMEPLTRFDESRPWRGRFEAIEVLGGYGWAAEFPRRSGRTGLLRHLESLAWPYPGSVQVLMHDVDDECFGLWMLHDGVLTEVPLPRTRRFHLPAPETLEFPPHPGFVLRTDDGSRALPEQTPPHLRDPRPAW
ncbi:hypothetical protein [Embleya sp. NPDC005575]|uniref:hypothetical protein n=1 Tax=Embleya sp. NPDC005575 TaxID=3156892 RepID=UPI0033A26F9C